MFSVRSCASCEAWVMLRPKWLERTPTTCRPARPSRPIIITMFFVPLVNRIVSCWPNDDAVPPEKVAAGAAPGAKRTQPYWFRAPAVRQKLQYVGLATGVVPVAAGINWYGAASACGYP